MATLSKGHKPENATEWHNYLKLNLEASYESKYPDVFALCEKNLDNPIDSGYLSIRSYLPFIRQDSVTHMNGFAVYVKEGLHFVLKLPLENSADS